MKKRRNFPRESKSYFLPFFFLLRDLASCEQPVEEGPCSGNFERWYFDKESDVCRPFRYGGCKGTKNNFVTEQACQYQCKNPTVQKGTLLFFHLFECKLISSFVDIINSCGLFIFFFFIAY